MQLIFVAIGLAAGLLSGLFGIGGGIIIVPLLVLLMKMEPHTATGTSLMALLLPVGALAVWEYHKVGHVNVAGGLLIALGLFVGAYFGAKVGLSLNPFVTKRVFAVFLLLISARIWFTA
ncbi:MAG: sulfite exporter TauE/SafE family protein [Gemmatimonadota bacterium]|nr:sulfite exporter TauE/SafE family protein [Gemmatimonadota bacterium]